MAPLPIAAEVDAGLAPHRQRHDPVNLDAVRVSPVILAPGSFLGEPYQVRASEMVVVADLRPAHTAEKALRVVAVAAEQSWICCASLRFQ